MSSLVLEKRQWKGDILDLQTCERLLQEGREQSFLCILCGQGKAYLRARDLLDMRKQISEH